MSNQKPLLRGIVLVLLAICILTDIGLGITALTKHPIDILLAVGSFATAGLGICVLFIIIKGDKNNTL